MSDINQDDIDKLLQDALVGGGDDDDADGEGEDAPNAAPGDDAEDRGPASQDDIDALFAAVGGDDDPTLDEDPGSTDSALDPALFGAASQDDIDALFSAMDAAHQSEQPESKNAASATTVSNEINALFAAMEGESGGAAPEAEAEAEAETGAEQPAPGADSGPEPEPEPPAGGDGAIESFESQLAAAEAAHDNEGSQGQSDLDELLSSIADESGAPVSQVMPAHTGEKDETVRVDVDMDELLRQVSEAAPPPPPPMTTADFPKFEDAALDDILSEAPEVFETPAGEADILTGGPLPGEAGMPLPEPAFQPDMPGPEAAAAPAPEAPPPPPAQPEPELAAPPPAAFPAADIPPPPAPAAPPAAAPAAGRQEFTVLYGAGEVESVAGQISALLSSMSEKAHGYMQAWIAADREAKELRTRALSEERRRAVLESEKTVLTRELDDLRSRLGEVEGGRVAEEEARRTLETSYQARTRELESRVTLLTSEAEALKEELTRARNQATGVDLESRRVRFELERLKNEVESERMERLRIQRALENREKEVQALQSQQSGQASSLFIDELHRLVRRLESELAARTSGAHEALKQLDRVEVGEDMVPAVANVRAALMQAAGADADQDDALKALGRDAAGVRGAAAIAPEKAEMVSFESALATYNLAAAMDAAGALLRAARATPGKLMRKVYLCPALRRPEVGSHLDELSRLLEGLRTVQEAGDRSRGSETADSEVFYVHMFDFLHNLVRLKLLTRLSGELWRLFLDLRGRFSFVTSDRQWSDYRDQILSDKTPKA